MKIFGICCVRDEDDIVGATLEAALGWADRIFVFDNASVDGTTETLAELAERHPAIVLVGRDDRSFTDELRSDIFEQVKDVASPGDWWCRLDADEIYIDDPRAFLAEVPAEEGFVFGALFNFYFTDLDAAAHDEDPEGWLARPVPERLHHYENNWSEPRFVRHRDDLRWKGEIWPPNRGRTHRRRIRVRHFQYRSPEQITRRLANRKDLVALFAHEAATELSVPDAATSDWSADWLRSARPGNPTWRDRIRPASACEVDRGDGRWVSRDDLMPPLPSPSIDAIRARVQESRTGNAIVAPFLKRRRNRFRRGDLRL